MSYDLYSLQQPSLDISPVSSPVLGRNGILEPGSPNVIPPTPPQSRNRAGGHVRRLFPDEDEDSEPEDLAKQAPSWCTRQGSESSCSQLSTQDSQRMKSTLSTSLNLPGSSLSASSSASSKPDNGELLYIIIIILL